jgi:hypothetical protein
MYAINRPEHEIARDVMVYQLWAKRKAPTRE